MEALITILSEIIVVTGFSIPGAFIRWITGGRRKRFDDIYKEKDGKNGMIGCAAVVVLLILAFVLFLIF